MNTSKSFKELLTNIKIEEDKAEQISYRYGRITKTLNRYYRETASTTRNSLQVGSYGRYTGIKGISDLDMLYILPEKKWSDYNVEGGQSQLLKDAKEALTQTYSQSEIIVDRCVVTVKFSDSHIDVQPVFEIEDQNYKYPDTYNGGSWKITKPRKEMAAMKEADEQKNKNLRMLCKMARSWKNKSGVMMGGLLIDTLAYNFFKSTSDYDTSSYASYAEMCRDFFKFLYDQPKDQKEYAALGSRQRVKVRKSFRRKSKKAYELAVEAIEAESDKKKHRVWRDIFGKDFPEYQNEEAEALLLNSGYRPTEEFIESFYPVDIQYDLKINCEVSQHGYRTKLLRDFLASGYRLRPRKSLLFFVESIDVPYPYKVMWKVKNRGSKAIKTNNIRGQIINGTRDHQRQEFTSFRGDHFVECYVIKNGMVVARDLINVPISE